MVLSASVQTKRSIHQKIKNTDSKNLHESVTPLGSGEVDTLDSVFD